MSEEQFTFEIGYTAYTRRYMLHASIAIAIAILIMWIFSFYHSLIPVLFALGSLTVEMWWRTKKTMALSGAGIIYGKGQIKWSDIDYYTTWGPIGIPLTPLRYDGMLLYLKNGKKVSVNSTYRGYDQLKTIVQEKTTSEKQPEWNGYSLAAIRAIRYILGIGFSILYVVALSFLPILIVVLIVAGYLMFRRLANTRRQGKAFPEDIWMSVFGSVALFSLFLALTYFPFLQLLVGFPPVLLLIWFPWHPKPLKLVSDTLFVGPKQAYPLRHLRTERTTSKYFVLKTWQLNFANGNVEVYPLLENFEKFKAKFEQKWEDIQQKYYGRQMSEEEAQILSPQEEAERFHGGSKDDQARDKHHAAREDEDEGEDW